MKLLLLLALLGVFSFKQNADVQPRPGLAPKVAEEAEAPQLQKKPVPKVEE